MSWYSRCSWCGGPFNGGNCQRCTNKKVYVVNGVLASGVDMVLEKDLVGFALQEMEIHPLMFLVQTISMILQNPSTRHTQCELCGNDSHYGYDCPPRFPLVYEQEPSYNQNFVFNRSSRNLNQQRISDVNDRWDKLNESQNELLNMMQSFCEMAANLSTYSPKSSRRFNFFCYDDNDYEESTIPLNEIVSLVPPSIAITPILPIEKLEDSLIMGDEDLSTIPEKESNEVIKSSVKDLVLIPSESEDTSGSDSEYDLSSYDDFSLIDVPEGKSVTFSNPLFDSNDDFTSSDDESLSDEDVPEDNTIKNKDSYDSNPDEPDLLVTPLSNANEDECFDPGDDVDKIELLRDPSTPKMSVASFSKEPVASHQSGTFMCFNIYPNILNESPMEICSSTRFNPNITMIWGLPGFKTLVLVVLSIVHSSFNP
uniref:Uncharacterized protein n=1 Tax=Tanacetum cinerariifolium TaxID=118510 RepID=A0A6L2JKB4_TANCI|nr:hypothetical protein [Tanacetum cinerariifolium]